MQRELDMKSRVREIRKPGSVGARGEQSPRATRLVHELGRVAKGVVFRLVYWLKMTRASRRAE